MSINHLAVMQYCTKSGRKYFIEEVDFDIYVYIDAKGGYMPIFNIPLSLKPLLKTMIEGFDIECYNQIDFNHCTGDILDETYGATSQRLEQEKIYGGSEDEYC